MAAPQHRVLAKLRQKKNIWITRKSFLQKEVASKDPRWIKLAPIYISIVALLATIVLGTIQGLLNSSTLTLANRAWLQPKGWTGVSTPTADKKAMHLSIDTSFENIGKSPAIITKYSTDWYRVPQNQEYDSPFVAMTNQVNTQDWDCETYQRLPNPAIENVVYPGADNGRQLSQAVGFPPFDVTDVIDGKTLLIIGGCISYKSFGDLHHAWYCIVAVPPKAPAQVWTFPFCLGGNGAD